MFWDTHTHIHTHTRTHTHTHAHTHTHTHTLFDMIYFTLDGTFFFHSQRVFYFAIFPHHPKGNKSKVSLIEFFLKKKTE